MDNSTVTLRGTVKSDHEKTDLENRVKQVNVVQNLKNELQVKSDSSQQQPSEDKK